jgi:tetratricopeptide (TPR) repeat protein
VRAALPILLLLLIATPCRAAVYTWVDEDGITHIADDPSGVPEEARGQVREGRAELRELWDQGVLGAVRSKPAAKSIEGERVRRLERGAVEDLERGETARASVALRSALRLDPRSAAAHWYLSILDHQRGRYDSAGHHLEQFLSLAGDDYQEWRVLAQGKLADLADERRVADASQLPSQDRFLGADHPHFRVSYDAELGRASSDYAGVVLSFLEEAYDDAGERMGAVPAEPLGVKLYGKAAYLRAHRHRFTFQTVGFFDGRIHVVSAAHPTGELRALLFHEYTHAVFREQTGGDRPFWLNEGMAELAERASRRQTGLSRSERSLLRRRIDAGRWISLRRLAPSFAGLEDEDARAAYLISAVAAGWLSQHTNPSQRARILARLGEGVEDDEVFSEILGMSTEQVDAAVQSWIREEFPAARPLRDAGDLPAAAPSGGDL